MKCTYVLLLACCLLSAGLAKPAVQYSKYQDSYGLYSFGYSGPTSARSEVRTADGTIRGTYSYIDDAGAIQTARYIADEMGFRVIATNVPQGLVYLRTPEEVGLLQFEGQEADRAANLGENNVFLKQAKQEAALTPGDNQQAAGAASGAGTEAASGNPQTRIGENNVFLQQAKGVAGEKQLAADAGGSIIIPSADSTREADRNEFLKLLNQWKASVSVGKLAPDGKIGNAEENVKSDVAGVAASKGESSQESVNIAAKTTEGESAQKGDTLSQDVTEFLKYIGF